MLESFKKIVVVAGCQRSGTTLTGQILGAHPDALMIDEPEGLYRWFDAYVAGDLETATLWDAMMIASNGKYRPGQKRVNVAPDGGYKVAPNVTHLVFKAPNMTYSYNAIARFGPPVSVVYPVRDPRSVVASITKLHRIPMVEKQRALIGQHPALAAELAEELTLFADDAVPMHVKRALMWRIKSCLFDRFTARGLPVLRYRYEDLVADPAGHCMRIAEHVGLEFDERMLAHGEVYTGVGPGGTDRTRPVDTQSISLWADQLTAAQEADILRVARDAMTRLGYDPTAALAAEAAPASIP